MEDVLTADRGKPGYGEIVGAGKGPRAPFPDFGENGRFSVVKVMNLADCTVHDVENGWPIPKGEVSYFDCQPLIVYDNELKCQRSIHNGIISAFEVQQEKRPVSSFAEQPDGTIVVTAQK